MTRDEAIAKMKLAVPIHKGIVEQNYTNFVDCLAAVGVLKLDETLISRSSLMYQLYESLFEHIPTLDFMSFRELIDKSGLKITEK